jgi:hypothetical protein
MEVTAIGLHEGKELAHAWVVWAERLIDVVRIDLDRLELVALAPESEPAEVTMVIDPHVMAEAYPLLVREGLGF